MKLFSESVGFWEFVQSTNMTQEKITLAIWTFLIWRKFEVFDKVLGNFENLYLRNAIKIIHGGGLGRFEVWSSKHANIEKVLFFL